MALTDIPAPEPVEPETSWRAEYGPDGGHFEDIRTDTPLDTASDWAHVFEKFRLNPDDFEILGDTVRCSTWQQSKRTDGGDRDVIDLYSYRAQFRRKAVHVDRLTFDDMKADIRSWKPRQNRRIPGAGLGEPVVQWFGNADMQTGKGEGGGTPALKERFFDDLEIFLQMVKDRRKRGINVTGTVFANMGDPIESTDGHYPNQTFTVDLNQRDQLTTVLELWKTAIRELAPLGTFDFVNVLCNHGEWKRQDKKAFTGDADNASGFLGDTLRMLFDGHAGFDHVNWHLPRDEMITTATINGVNVAAAHGHKLTGKIEDWLTRQDSWLQIKHGFRPGLWALAHKHHAHIQDFGPYHAIQHTSLDGGSKSFTDATGKWATPGTTTFLLGGHDPRKFSHYEVI